MRKFALFEITLVFLLSFWSRAFAYDPRIELGKAVRISEFANSPAAKMLLVALDSSFSRLTETTPSWKTMPSETAEDRENFLRPSVAGTFDMIFTSDQDAVRELFDQGLLRSFFPIFKEEIILVGPVASGDSAGSDASAVMGGIFHEGTHFFSLMTSEWSIRAEHEMWKSAGIENPGDNKNYVQSSRDDVTAMFQAGDEGAFLLVGAGAFAQYREAQREMPVLEKIAGTGVYRKTYLCLVKNSGFRRTQEETASRFAAWLAGGEATEAVNSFDLAGLRPFEWLPPLGAPPQAEAP
jgi:ABC-type tungstate transport system permease subunit